METAKMPMKVAILPIEASCSGRKSAIYPIDDSTVNTTANIVIITRSFLPSNVDTVITEGTRVGMSGSLIEHHYVSVAF
jgi:hypothetical protein